jgi:hypothetical protein
MFRPRSRHRTLPRRGSTLLVVITLLALFAVIGLSFALYAGNEATAARMYRQAQDSPRDLDDFESALNPADYFNRSLAQMIFDCRDDDPIGVQSGLRGYGLNRIMYGQQRITIPGPPPSFQLVPQLTPYTGQGPFTAADDAGVPLTLPGGIVIPRSQVLNYAYQPNLPGLSYIIDPEYSWFRLNPADTNSAPGGTQVYKNIAAPYTYPDLKDLYLAVIDPTTGRVLQPSFFRDYAFNPTAPDGMKLAPPTVAPTNTDWLTPEGRLKIIRPRPEDHRWNGTVEFPYPPPNADGTYTGDVINFPGLRGNQRNDSIWVYPAGPVRTFRGKRYTALIAPMVIDLGGRVHLGVAGNRKSGNTDHASSMGATRSEINPRWVFDHAATTQGQLTPDSSVALQQLLSGAVFQNASVIANVAGRYGPTVGSNVPPPDRMTGQNQVQFNAGRIPPHYAGLDLDAVGSGTADRAIPAGSGTSPWPLFPNTRYPNDAATLLTELADHPAQYNPDHRSRLLEKFGPFFPIEQRVLGSRYAGLPEPYSRTDVARLAPKYLISGNFNTAQPFNPYATLPNPTSTINDPANVTRMLVTTFSTSLSRPELVVDVGGQQVARLGPIDVNRILPDYRLDPTKMLGPDNMGNWPAAQAARQRLARDIFVRLAALSHVPGNPNQPLIDGDNIAYVAVPPANPADYTDPNVDYGYLRIDPALYANDPSIINHLRDLAQVAVNMVDYLDPDDVSTTFTWNPVNRDAGYVVQPTGLPGVNPSTAAGGTPTAATPATPGSMVADDLGNHVVYGSEAPRLVLNEVYAELANGRADYNPAKGVMQPADPMQRAQQNFEKRFWLELFNPMRADPALSENGLARLHYPAGVFGLGGSYSPYTVVITNHVPGGVTKPENVTGSPKHPTAVADGVIVQSIVDQYTYDPATADFPPHDSLVAPNGVINEATTYHPYPPAVPSAGDSNINLYVVHPHSGVGGGASQTNQNGFCVLGPEQNFPGQDANNDPGTIAATIRVKPQASVIDPNVPCTLQVQATGNAQTDIDSNTQPVAIHLRRLANPYLPPNDPLEPSFNPALPPNPYVTVDRQEQVPVNNNVRFTSAGPVNPPPDPADSASLGRPHPFVGAADLAADQTTDQGGSPTSTFFNHNDNTGLPNTPFRWLIHLDRHVVNAVELAHVSAVRPTQVTEYFATTNPPPGYYRHTIESLLLPGVAGGRPVDTPPGPGYLRRALEFLVARGPQSGVPVGGREHGKVNINTIPHPAVLRALLDPNPANFFRDVDVSGVPGVSAWDRMTAPGAGLRSPVWPNVATTDPGSPGLVDNPFRGMGDVVFRGFDPDLGTRPLFYNQDPTDVIGLPASAQDHTAVIAEPLRKMWNNTTTTSDAFLVIMTVAFFEVRHQDPATGRVYLGKEFYEQVPGDRRFRFFAIVDRTQLALDPASAPPQYLQAPSTPWQTALVEDVLPGQTVIKVAASTNNPTNDPNVPTDAVVYADGVPVSLLGKQLRLGFGDALPPPAGINNGGDGEWVATPPLPPSAPIPIPQVVTWSNGVATIALSAPVTRYHAAGSPVTNYVLGNPGPQPSFNPNDPRYKPVVPYFARVNPSQ